MEVICQQEERKKTRRQAAQGVEREKNLAAWRSYPSSYNRGWNRKAAFERFSLSFFLYIHSSTFMWCSCNLIYIYIYIYRFLKERRWWRPRIKKPDSTTFVPNDGDCPLSIITIFFTPLFWEKGDFCLQSFRAFLFIACSVPDNLIKNWLTSKMGKCTSIEVVAIILVFSNLLSYYLLLLHLFSLNTIAIMLNSYKALR